MIVVLIGINAKYIHSNPAVYSLRACAGIYKESVRIREFTINQRMEEIRQEIYLGRPDVLAFSCYIWNISLIKELIADLGKILPATDIYLSGPEVSYCAEAVLSKNPAVKGILIGEGEVSFAKLLSCYANREKEDLEQALRNVPGLVTRDFVNEAGALPDLASIPFWYKQEGCAGVPAEFENRILYYESSRGCPFACSYCLSSIDKRVRFRPMEMVKEELDFFLSNKVKQVKFIDRTFNANPTRALEIWSYLKEHDNGVTNFHFEIAADIITKEELECLGKMRPGQVQLEIGVQTTNPETLREIRRTTDMEKLRRNVEILRGFQNMHLHLDLIVGLPYEDMASFIRSFNEVYAMGADDLQLGFLKVLHGSYMEEMRDTYGIVSEEKEPYEVLSTNWISYEDVIRLKKIEEMLSLYANSGQFANTIAALENCFPTPFEMFEALADFYEKKGYFVQTPARSRRYEVLLEFVEEAVPEKKHHFEDLLTLDFYLRENPKSRPSFAKGPLLPQKRSALVHAEYFATFTNQKGTLGKYFIFDYTKRNPVTGNAEVTETDEINGF
ncbi:MAG: B12-binding domain-containing radical SAM protein [Lachnospiraceae bacterium]|nr:B12-binding domain-containing radical SAM protein [Lachnospiraceae bacterium]